MIPEVIDNIPVELRKVRQWVCWKFKEIKDEDTGEIRHTKIPINPNGRAQARSNDPNTWNTFELALKVSEKCDGIGYIVSADDPYTVIDLDHCVSVDITTGEIEIEEWAQSILNRLNSYSEFSPSGRGIHIFIRGKKPGPRCRTFKHPQFEMYDNRRFLAMTGHSVIGFPKEIASAGNELIELYKEIFGGLEPEITKTVQQRIADNCSPIDLSDFELIEKAKQSKRGSEFADLWYGNTTDYGGDDSAAALALCNHLAFWTQKDASRMDRLFRESGLMRSKWDSSRPEGTWGSKTISKAITDTNSVYKGKENGSRVRLDKAITDNCIQIIDELESKCESNGKPDLSVTSNMKLVQQSSNLTFLDDSNNESPLFEYLIPPNSYLESYVRFGMELTDAPAEFHLAVGLSTLAAVAGNKIYTNAWGTNIFPNLWIVILAPSGFYRKSTAISIGLKALRGSCQDAVLPDDFTREKLVECLMKQPYGIIPVYEFGELLARLGRDYNAGLKEFLTAIFDGNPYKRATKRETIEIDDPALSILAASTIDWICDRITDGDMRGGFLARYLFWPSVNKNGWKGISDAADMRMLDHLQDCLGKFAEVSGQIQLSPSYIEEYNTWVYGHEQEVNEKRLPPEIMGFYTRLSTYVLKLSMLYQLAIDGQTHMSLAALQYAINLAEHLKSHLVRLVSEEMTTTKDAKDLKRVREVIERNPGITKTCLLRNCHLTSQHLDPLLTTLLESNQVIVQRIETGKKPKDTFYVNTKTDE